MVIQTFVICKSKHNLKKKGMTHCWTRLILNMGQNKKCDDKSKKNLRERKNMSYKFASRGNKIF